MNGLKKFFTYKHGPEVKNNYKKWKLLNLLIILLLGLFAHSLIQIHQQKIAGFDALDEGAHLDYVIKMSEGDIPSWDSKYGQKMMQVNDCVNPALISDTKCGTFFREAINYPPLGISYEAQQPPLGYLTHLISYKVTQNSTFDAKNVLNEVRDISSLINLSLVLIICAAIVTLLKFKWHQTVLFMLPILFTPMLLHANSIVTNDSFVLVGTLTFILISFYAQSHSKISRQFVLGILVGVFLGLIKGTLVLLPLAFLFATAFVNLNRNTIKKNLHSIFATIANPFYVSCLISASAAYSSYFAWQANRSTFSSTEVYRILLSFVPESTQFSASSMFQSVVGLANIFSGYLVGLDWEISAYSALNLATWFLIGYALQKNKAHTLATYLTVIFSGILMNAFIWQFLLFLGTEINIGTPSRYSIAFLPFYGLILASILDKNNSQKLLGMK